MTEPKVKHLKVATKSESRFLDEIAQLVQNARNAANSAVSSIIVVTNWNIGRRIVEQEQKGKNRAAYGDRLVELISEDLTRKFGDGYGKQNVQYFGKFYLLFNDFEIVNTCVRNLNWSHFKRLLSVSNDDTLA